MGTYRFTNSGQRLLITLLSLYPMNQQSRQPEYIYNAANSICEFFQRHLKKNPFGLTAAIKSCQSGYEGWSHPVHIIPEQQFHKAAVSKPRLALVQMWVCKYTVKDTFVKNNLPPSLFCSSSTSITVLSEGEGHLFVYWSIFPILIFCFQLSSPFDLKISA